jgi:hypothetical protein
MHQSSVGVFVPFLANLSDLLDRAAGYAELRKIDPAILLDMRLYPNMYNLARQVGEANRHAVVGCALLAGCDPCAFPDTEPDIAELKSRIATAVKFILKACRAMRSTVPPTVRSVSDLGAAWNEALPGGRCC